MPRSPEIIEKEISQHKLDIKRLQEELKSATVGLIKCTGCDSYFKPEDLTEGSYKETTTECVYTDAGYGDDDEYAEVTRIYIVKRCPKCGKELDRKSFYLGESNRRCRTQYKK